MKGSLRQALLGVFLFLFCPHFVTCQTYTPTRRLGSPSSMPTGSAFEPQHFDHDSHSSIMPTGSAFDLKQLTNPESIAAIIGGITAGLFGILGTLLAIYCNRKKGRDENITVVVKHAGRSHRTASTNSSRSRTTNVSSSVQSSRRSRRSSGTTASRNRKRKYKYKKQMPQRKVKRSDKNVTQWL
mmetsp:Transcript_30746/g.46617  ORF Transcript_30746/g.46617 Transcript_30746/m.46617 type:complete len:184 (+) Transcript_30746:141-692(+)